MIWTIIAIGLINAVAAYGLAHLVSPGRAPVISTPIVVIATIGGIVALFLSIRGWRSHFRRRRMVS
jgi:hypothetical protein